MTFGRKLAGTLLLTLFVLTTGGVMVASAFFAPEAGPQRYQGMTIRPVSAQDFGSSEMNASLERLSETGASHVAFIIPYYQTDIHSADLAHGPNTPTDDALISAITAAHSHGLQTVFKVHVETHDLEWRAHIDPHDRAVWFARYGDLLVHLAGIAEEHDVVLITVGTEMVNLATAEAHPDNTKHWIELIDRVRAVYSGKLMYSANSTSNKKDRFMNEKEFIEFWPHLDYVGLSVYYTLSTLSPSVNSIMAAWDHWNANDLEAFAARVDKPIIFAEVGYRSINGTRHDPWDWTRTGDPNEEEQANAYEALLAYWEGSETVHGVFFWHWEADPHTGGPTSSEYTPQNKKAELVLTEYWSGDTLWNRLLSLTFPFLHD